MQPISQELVALLIFLLLGFLSAWVYYGFTSSPKPGQFERVVQALIFTILIQVLVLMFSFVYSYIPGISQVPAWGEKSQLVLSAFFAILLGVLFAFFTNNDKLALGLNYFNGVFRPAEIPFHVNQLILFLHHEDVFKA